MKLTAKDIDEFEARLWVATPLLPSYWTAEARDIAQSLIDDWRAMRKVVEAAGNIGCAKMGGSCCMNGFNDLKDAFAKLAALDGKDTNEKA